MRVLAVHLRFHNHYFWIHRLRISQLSNFQIDIFNTFWEMTCWNMAWKWLIIMNFELCVGPLKLDFWILVLIYLCRGIIVLSKGKIFQVDIFYNFGDMVRWKIAWKLLIFSWTLSGSWVHLSFILDFGFEVWGRTQGVSLDWSTLVSDGTVLLVYFAYWRTSGWIRKRSLIANSILLLVWVLCASVYVWVGMCGYVCKCG